LNTLDGTPKLTLFAPNDDAFKKLDSAFLDRLLQNQGFSIHLVQLLLYHVTFASLLTPDLFEGRQIVTLSQASLLVVFREAGIIILNTTAIIEELPGATTPSRIINPNRITTNGVIHEMNEVLLPDFAYLDIVDVLTRAGTFNIFLALIIASGEEEDLRTNTRMLLAPNDDAFAAAPAGTLDLLQNPANAAVLSSFVRNHVSATVLTSLQLQSTSTITTLDGNALAVRAEFNPNTNVLVAIFVEDQQIIQFNLLARNGIIHGLSGILLPPGFPFV
jgi:uncharacterized surface protein with fasciclin (FAS1) repeats